MQKDVNWLLEACYTISEKDRNLLIRAFGVAEQYLNGHFRENGDPLLYHALTVARMAVEDVGLSASTAIAVLLHEAFQQAARDVKNKTPEEIIALKKIKEKEAITIYGTEIANIITGLNKIAAIDIKKTNLQAENFRKLIVSYSTDPRVTIIKLCDRLEVMQSLEHFSKTKQAKKATETLLLYAPIAHQLGLYNIKSELEDLSLKYTEPEAFRTITAKLKMAAGERQKLLLQFLNPITEALNAEQLKYEIKSRTKSVYSIWKKMQAQHISFEKISDIYAIRIILDTPFDKEMEDAACWQVYSIIQKIYATDDSRLRDWISQPRKSGYRSLHMTVLTDSGQAMEVQIRTTRMDDEAERGAAAHWKYKGVEDMGGMQAWLDKVRHSLETPDDNTSEYFTNIKLSEIIVLTPTGDLRRLPAGASAIDFAFDLHTNIGLRLSGAKVNGHIVPIKEKLHTGDVVEVLTSKKAQPTADWLNHIITSKARSKIKQKLREEETKQAQEGKELLERRLKNWKIPLTDDVLALLLKHYKFKTITDLYANLAAEKIDSKEIKELLTSKTEEQATPHTSHEQAANEVQGVLPDGFLFIDKNLKNAQYKLAKCCNPILGDDIFGFVTIGDGITIHRFSCPNAVRLLDKYPYRVINAKWQETQAESNFLVRLRLRGHNETGVVTFVTDTVSTLGCQMRAINFAADKQGQLNGELTVLVKDTRQLDTLLFRLRQIKGIDKVIRVKT